MCDFKERIKATKARFIVNPKLGPLAPFLMELEIVEDSKLPHYAGVTTKTMYVNPVMCQELSDKKLLGLIAHEVMHNVLMHNIRFKSVNPALREILNIAMDIVINLKLRAEGFELPDGGAEEGVKKMFDIDASIYTDKSTDEVFKDLLERLERKGGQGSRSEDNDYHGDVLGKDKKDNRPDEIIEVDTTSRLINAGGSSIAGGLSEVREMIEEFNRPKYDWKNALIQYASAHCKDDYSYKVLNPHYYPDFFLPTLNGEVVESMATFMDTSGSVSSQMLRNILNSTAGMRNMLEPEETIIGCFDHKLHNIQSFDKYAPFSDYEPQGGGGTNVHNVMDWIKENKPVVTVIFTDGEFDLSLENPGHDVVWVIYDNTNFKPPFGKVIYYNEDLQS